MTKTTTNTTIMTWLSLLCVLLLLGAVFCVVNAQQCQDVIVRDKKLYVQGTEFYIQGILYRPEPLDLSTVSSDGDSSGICSPRTTVFGTEVSACEGFDYYTDYWGSIWERDLPHIQEVGANVIRAADMDDYTVQYIAKFHNDLITNPENAGSHVSFLDAAESHGLKVIVPLMSNDALVQDTELEELQKFIEARIDELGNHPALLMFTVGDAMSDLGTNKDLRDRINWSMFYARKYMTLKNGRRVPLTTVMVDDTDNFVTIAEDVNVDLFTANVGFRGLSLNSVWYGDEDVGGTFPGFAALGDQYDRPLMVGQWGIYNANQQETPEWVNIMWKEVVEHMRFGSIGGVYHQFMDTSVIPADARLHNTGIVTRSEGVQESEGELVLDSIQPRTDVFNALKGGYPNGEWKDMNYNNEDVWGLASFWEPATQTSIDISACPDYPKEEAPLGFDPEPYDDPQDDGAGGGTGGGSGGGGGGGGGGTFPGGSGNFSSDRARPSFAMGVLLLSIILFVSIM